MYSETKALISNFISDIWNDRKFGLLDKYLHQDYEDHSLPPAFPKGKEGLEMWITHTSKSFHHFTTIEEQLAEDCRCVVQVSIRFEHIGTWRGIEPTGKVVKAPGFRMFKVQDGLIADHRALIDGNFIESQLRAAP